MRVARVWRSIVGSEPVTRRQYVALAVGLAVIKYLGDALALAPALPAPWGPADYLRGLILPPEAWPKLGPMHLAFLLSGGQLPWLAVDISRRRAVDPGGGLWA